MIQQRPEAALAASCMVDDENTASWRIAERLGFALDSTEQHHGRPVRRYVWPE